MKLHCEILLYFILSLSVRHYASMVQADSDSLEDSLTIHQLFKRASDREDFGNNRRYIVRSGTTVANAGNQTTTSRKHSLKELGNAYNRSGKKAKLARKLLKLDSEDRIKFFRQQQLRDDKKYRRKVLRMLRKQAKKNKRLRIKNKKKLSAASLIFQINSALNLTHNLWEADIMIPDIIFESNSTASADDVKNKLLNADTNNVNKRSTATSGIGSNIWSGGIVPYIFDNGYKNNDKTKIESVMQDIEEKTCIKFVPRTNEQDYVHILAGLGCSAPVGNHAGIHIVSLDHNSCTNTDGIIAHELGHVLGLHHTQSRLDRDDYINIDLSKVDAEHQHNFDTYANPHTDDFAVEYDYNSVMHYGSADFSNDGSAVITPTVPSALIGQRLSMSYFDYVTINQMYGCFDKTPYYWPMDEIDTIDKNIIGSSIVTPSNPATIPSNYLVGLDSGKYLNALRIKGTEAYANLGSFPGECLVDPEQCDDGFTYGMWYKKGDSSSGMTIHLLSSREPPSQSGTATDRGIDIWAENVPYLGDVLFVKVQKKSECAFRQSTGLHSGWNHITVVFTPKSGYYQFDKIEIYIDGVKDQFIFFPCPHFYTPNDVNDVTPTLISGLPPTLPDGHYVDFWIDDIVFYPRKLSSTDIMKLKLDGAYFDKGLSDGSLGKRDDVVGQLTSFETIL